METQEQSSRLVYGLPGKELYTVKCVLVGLSASPFSLLEAALGN